jgi:hypothetical protein
MGIETAECPTCGRAVRFGVPLGGSLVDVEAGEVARDGDGTKTRVLACPEGHRFSVTFTI